jgi:ABC-type multidrug transport system fused ATPase/permease subunit
VTPGLSAAFLVALICSGFLCVRVVDFSFVVKRLTALDVVVPPTAATISIMFGLFVAFGASDVMQRSRELRLAVQKEINVTRAIFKFAESVGASANPVRQALIEYLQAVTTLEQTWLERSSETESPAQSTADTLVQVVTLFVVQSPAPPLS